MEPPAVRCPFPRGPGLGGCSQEQVSVSWMKSPVLYSMEHLGGLLEGEQMQVLPAGSCKRTQGAPAAASDGEGGKPAPWGLAFRPAPFRAFPSPCCRAGQFSACVRSAAPRSSSPAAGLRERPLAQQGQAWGGGAGTRGCPRGAARGRGSAASPELPRGLKPGQTSTAQPW